MWVRLIKFTSFLGRLAALPLSVVSLAFISLTLSERDWMDGISIYIVVIACLSILAAPIPPYPNFIFDGLFATAWSLAAIFSLLILFLKSTCYGLGDGDTPSGAVSCTNYKILVVMCFLTFAFWAGCAGGGFLLLLIAIFKNARMRSNHHFLEPTIYREEDHYTTLERTPSVATVPDESKLSFGDKKGFPYEKKDDDRISPIAAPAVAPVATPVVATDRSYVEEEYAPKEPEYMRVSGLFADFILANWLWLGLAAFILAVIAIPILIKYALPAFAYYVTDNIQFPNSLYGSITAFEENYATFDIHSDIKTPSGISLKLDPTSLMLFNPETLPNPLPIAYVETSHIKIKGGEILTIYNQTIKIGNLSEWTHLWRKFAFQPTMQVGVKGRLTAHAGPFKISVDTTKLKTFQGLLATSSLQFEYLRLQPPDKDGCNVVLAVPLNNSSPLSVNSKATATASFLIGDTAAAAAYIDAFTLTKGVGTIPVRARTDLASILGLLENITDVLGTELPYLGQGMAVSTLQATSITDQGHTWPYWTAAAKAIKLDAGIELQPLVGGLLGEFLGEALSGDGGSFITTDPTNTITNINVTLINKVLKNLTIVDADLVQS